MFQLTRLTATQPAEQAKRFEREEGKLRKTTCAALIRGRIETITLERPEDLIPVLAGLTTAQSLVLGVPCDEAATRIVTRKMMLTQGRPGSIARTTEGFHYAAAGGFLLIDHDGLPDGRCLTREELLELLYEAVPDLRGVKIIALPSSSSHICRTDTGEDLTGSRGLHLHIPLLDARDIPRVGMVIALRLWLAGHGHVLVARNGNRLLRCPVDTSVWQPNRIVFAAGAICGPGLEQRRGHPVLVNPEGADAWDSRATLPDPDAATEELVKAAQEHARAQARQAAEEARETWLATERPALLRRLGADPVAREEEEALIRAVEKHILGPDLVLFVKRSGEPKFSPVPVAAVLADRIGYHRAITLDPVEPDYNGQAAVGCLFLDGRTPVLHSMAHGGATYRLEAALQIIEVHAGQMRKATEAVLACMRADGRFFDYGSALVTVHAGRLQVIDEHMLELMLGDLRFLKPDPRGQLKPIDPPVRLLRQILSLGTQRRLNPLTAVLDRPILNAEGRLLDRPGYHAAEGLYLDFEAEDWPAIPETLSEEEARAALDVIWTPFRQYPLVDAASRGALLAGILTAILRPVLRTAPMLVSDAPVMGTGKTSAMETVASIGAGRAVSVSAPMPESDPAEMRKLLTSAALGSEGSLLFDNCTGTLSSAPLSAFLTSEAWSDRLLGANILRDGLPTRILVGATGTNIALDGELQRRALRWRLDARAEQPGERRFDFCPKELALKMHKDIVCAALALLRAALAADLPQPPFRFASFTAWDRLVRTTLRHAEALSGGHFADPVPGTVRALRETDDTIHLHDLLCALREPFGALPFSARDLYEGVEASPAGPLADLIAGLTQRSERLSSKSIGRYLSQYCDRPCGDRVLRARRGGKALTFVVAEWIPPEGSPAPPAASAEPPLPQDILGLEFTSEGERFRALALDRGQPLPVLACSIARGTSRRFPETALREALAEETRDRAA
ncbi:DNA primase small subunit domain-containing protein [Rhodobacter sp. NSM]|uniref:DNA primase small subunit domain-containing protein n=1 Tax=Rhodobacter sp. NSM TaxID=3457501 RepID=UPI003FD37A60